MVFMITQLISKESCSFEDLSRVLYLFILQELRIILLKLTISLDTQTFLVKVKPLPHKWSACPEMTWLKIPMKWAFQYNQIEKPNDNNQIRKFVPHSQDGYHYLPWYQIDIIMPFFFGKNKLKFLFPTIIPSKSSIFKSIQDWFGFCIKKFHKYDID